MAAAFVAPGLIHAPGIQENRVLAPRPAWPGSLHKLGVFRTSADAYVADHFPVRPHLIGLLNRVRMLAGVSGSKRVIIGRDGWLFFDDDTHMGAARNDPPMAAPQVRGWLMALAGRTEYVRAYGGTYLMVAPPYKEMIYPQHGPAWFRGPAPDRPGVVLPQMAAATGAGEVISLAPAIAAATRAGAPTYSRHDTHWTGYGAYAGYVGLMNRLHAMGLTGGPRPLSDFQAVKATGVKLPRDLALMLGVASLVRLNYPHFEDPAAQARVRTEYLSRRHDWTAPQVLETGEVGKPTLLLVRDSYSNEMLPFLYSHFSRIILTHIQDGFWRQDLIDRYRPQVVITEVIEPGLPVAVGDAPAPSADAVGRIDRVLSPPAASRPGARPTAPTPSLTADLPLLAALNSARKTPNCNLEAASLAPGEGGAASLHVSGWISELGSRVTSPRGAIRLRGPAGDVAGAIPVDRPRPDVAAAFKNPTGQQSGFEATFPIQALPKGPYAPVIYRRAPDGWIACEGKQALVAP